MQITAADVHNKMQAMFPFLVAEGWSYKGFEGRAGKVFIALKFQKSIKGRAAYAKLSLALSVLMAPDVDNKTWIVDELRKVEADMVDRWLQEFAGAA